MSPRATPPGACWRFRFFVSCWALRAWSRPSASSWSAAQALLSAFSQRFISYGRGGGVGARLLARRRRRVRAVPRVAACWRSSRAWGGAQLGTLARARSNDFFDRAMLVRISRRGNASSQAAAVARGAALLLR